MKKPDKKLSGKSDEIEVKICKNQELPTRFGDEPNYFLLPNSYFRHCLSFAVRKVSFDRAKGYVSPPQTSPFTRRNMVFRAAKPYLSQIRIL